MSVFFYPKFPSPAIVSIGKRSAAPCSRRTNTGQPQTGENAGGIITLTHAEKRLDGVPMTFCNTVYRHTGLEPN